MMIWVDDFSPPVLGINDSQLALDFFTRMETREVRQSPCCRDCYNLCDKPEEKQRN